MRQITSVASRTLLVERVIVHSCGRIRWARSHTFGISHRLSRAGSHRLREVRARAAVERSSAWATMAATSSWMARARCADEVAGSSEVMTGSRKEVLCAEHVASGHNAVVTRDA
jgi:hypothetical protein